MSARWLSSLRSTGAERDQAIQELHALLLRAARFEVARRASALPARDRDDLAVQAADDALMHVLDKLDTFEGRSRFTTWVYKFAIYEAGVKARRRSWQDREVTLEAEAWSLLPDSDSGPAATTEVRELMHALEDGILTTLTAHQRNVLVALAVTGVPIDVLAERLGTTRGALYKTLHDARRKLRGHLSNQGLAVLADGYLKETR
ncbi:MAG: sigma-70 family RNA polymerase sigma factor [Actinobacteria bacterium]|nr:sigma-70 family RNA polymerase sigma factor [Actinomycetota bacterium]